MQKLDVRRCDSGHVRYWNIQTMRMIAKARVEVLNDIGQYFKVHKRR